MNWKRYSEEAAKFDKGITINAKRAALVRSALGIAGEAGEVVDCIKKFMYKKDITRSYLKLVLTEEIGDLLWYVSLLMRDLDLSLDEVLTSNLLKLEARYGKLDPNVDV